MGTTICQSLNELGAVNNQDQSVFPNGLQLCQLASQLQIITLNIYRKVIITQASPADQQLAPYGNN